MSPRAWKILSAVILASQIATIGAQGAVERDTYGGGMGARPCSDFTKLIQRPDFEDVFYTWAQGFLTGFNMAAPEGQAVLLTPMTRDQQKRFLREFCDQNPAKPYIFGVSALIARLRELRFGIAK